MQTTPRPPIGLAALLAALAGFVDALAYGSVSGFFASSMTGNMTRAGAGVATARYGDALMGGALVLAFLGGVVTGSIIDHVATGRRRAVMMAAVTLLLAGAAATALFETRLAFLMLAAAMGVQNNIFARDGDIAVGLTYMTGSLVRFGQKVVGAMMRTQTGFAWTREFELIAGFLAGITIGGLVYADIGADAFWIAAAAGAGCTLLLAILPDDSGRRIEV